MEMFYYCKLTTSLSLKEDTALGRAEQDPALAKKAISTATQLLLRWRSSADSHFPYAIKGTCSPGLFLMKAELMKLCLYYLSWWQRGQRQQCSHSTWHDCVGPTKKGRV